MRKRIVAVPVLALAFGLAGGSPAMAHGGGHSGHGGQDAAPVKSAPVAPQAPGKAAFFTAKLNGAAEVPPPTGAKVGDPDGSAVALIKVKGNRVTYAINYKGITAPTLGHIHQGAAGVNGDVKVPLFTTALPATVTAAAGRVSVTPDITSAIVANPAGFYVNLHTAEFGGGAVRAQLKPAKAKDLLGLLHNGGKFRALLSGEEEVPKAGGPAVDDPDGFASAFVNAKKDQVDYAFAWVGIAPPTLLHLHQGNRGINGDVKVNLATTPVPAGVFAVAGTVAKVDPAITAGIRKNPKGFYLNVHTAEFPGGALRAQLHKANRR